MPFDYIVSRCTQGARAITVGIALTAGFCGAVFADAWPSKPVTMIVNFPPGGSTDQVARAISASLGKTFNQTFIVDNRAGATGTIGATAAKRAAPDGYTLLVTSLGPLVIVPHLMKGLQYDALKDLDPITVAVQAPNVLVVPTSSRFRSLAEIIAYAKANPDKISFGTSGSGSSDHLTTALFWQQTGTTGIHVPYKGGAPLISDLLGGQVDASFTNVNATLQQIRAGKLRALAVTGDKRSPVLPDVPTLSEAGVYGADVYSWQAVVAPKGTPDDIKAKLVSAIHAALNEAGIKQQFTSLGFEIVANTPAQFAAFEAKESARWQKVIEVGKITAE